MAVVFMRARNDARYIIVDSITIPRSGLNVDLSNLTKQALYALVQEFEEGRLEVGNVQALFDAAGEILNEAGTGSAGPVIIGGGTGTGDGTDPALRVEIGARATDYVNIFLNALNN